MTNPDLSYIIEQLQPLAVPCESLTLDPKNARTHNAKNLKAITGSLEKFGQRIPIVVQKTGMVVRAGNGRLMAAREMGWTHIAAVVTDDADAMAAAFAIADNRTAELAEWDYVALGDALKLIQEHEEDIDVEALMTSVAFSDKQVEKLIHVAEHERRHVAEDETPEPPAAPVTQLGDVWTLGRHKVVCGDCSEVAGTAFSGKYELLVTDPPYGVSYAGKNEALNALDGGDRIETEIENDHLAPQEMREMWERWFTAIRPFAADGASYYVTGPQGGDLLLLLLEALRASGFPLRHMLIWAKNNHVLGRCDYNYKHEPILYGWVEGAGHRFYGPGGSTSLWEIDRPNKSKLHPTMKPVELFARAIENSTKPGDVVADPFLGSGTTLIAAEQLGRTCYGTEISPAYCDVVIERWENLTGEKARRQAS